jgi:hypothetical protein
VPRGIDLNSYVYRLISVVNRIDLPYSKINDGDIHNLTDILASLLLLGMQDVTKYGLKRAYDIETVTVNKVRGKILFGKSVSTGALARGQLVCEVNQLRDDNVFNQTLKYAITLLLRPSKRDRESCRLSSVKAGKLSYYRQSLHEVRDNSRISGREFILRKAPFYYQFALRVAFLIIDLYTGFSKDGRARLSSLGEYERCTAVFEKYIRYMLGLPTGAKRAHLSYEDEDGIECFYPDIVVYRHEENKAIALDVSWVDKSRRVNIRRGHQYNTLHYEELVNREYPDYKVARAIVFADLFGESEYSEYSSDHKYNSLTGTHEFYLYLNNRDETIQKTLARMIDGLFDDMNRRGY